MADKTVITPQQRFKVLTKLFEAGFKSEKDLALKQILYRLCVKIRLALHK